MAYAKTTWVNNRAPAISSNNLNKIENGLFDQDARITTAEGEIEAMCGIINMWATSTPPLGYLLCDGSAVSRVTYSSLFAVLGTSYGVGDGSTTFNLPNLKGKIPVGYNASETEFNTIGKTGGEKAHSLTADENGPHVHNVSIPYDNAQDGYADLTGREANSQYSKNFNTLSSGLGTPHNNLQPYIVLNYIIKY